MVDIFYIAGSLEVHHDSRHRISNGICILQEDKCRQSMLGNLSFLGNHVYRQVEIVRPNRNAYLLISFIQAKLIPIGYYNLMIESVAN